MRIFGAVLLGAAIALGGMDARKFVRAEKDGFYGWAAIDAWIQ